MKLQSFDDLFTYAMKLVANKFKTEVELHCKAGNVECGISKFIVYPDGRIIKQERNPYGCIKNEVEIQQLKLDQIL